MSQLYEFQRKGVIFLSSRRTAILADEMGLGKSAQAITAADEINAQKILVICPGVARINWLREFQKFSSKTRKSFIVSTGEDRRCVRSSDASLVITSYGLAADNPSDFCLDFDLIILDECHFLKSPTTKRTLNILGKEGIIHGQRFTPTNELQQSASYIRRDPTSKEGGRNAPNNGERAKTKRESSRLLASRQTPRIWVLSGTPAPNHAGELWPILRCFGLTSLTYQDFIQRFCDVVVTTFGTSIKGTKTALIPEVRKLFEKSLLRRTKIEVKLQMPPITFQDVFIEGKDIRNELDLDPYFLKWVFPTDRREELYAILRDQELNLENSLSGHDALEVLGSLAKSVSTLRMYTGIQKTPVIAKIIKEELEQKLYDKVVIFAIHKSVIEGLRRELAPFKPVTLYQGTPIEKQQKNIDDFQTKRNHRIFIGNILACGTAINLTAAHHVVFAEESWVPGDNAQAAARCHRIGQQSPVTVRRFLMQDSLDSRISKILKRKTEELTLLYGDEKHVSTNSHEQNLEQFR